MTRKYQRKQHLLKQINEMLALGMTQQEVADELGLTGNRPVHELLKRERRKKIPGVQSCVNSLGCPDKLTQSYGITPSMSSKGNPYDNAMAENFFSILLIDIFTSTTMSVSRIKLEWCR